MSYLLSLYQWLDWLDELSVQHWVHGRKRCVVSGMHSREVQDCHGRLFVRRVRRRKVPHNYGSYSSKRLSELRRWQILYGYRGFQ